MESKLDESFLADVAAFLDELDASHIAEDPDCGTRTPEDGSSPTTHESETEQFDGAQAARSRRNLMAAKRRLRYRQKLRTERDSLLQQESELSSELRQLQAVHAENNKETNGTLALRAWRSVAKRQQEKRGEAEQQRKQLRAAVVSRGRLIRQMKALMQKTFASEMDKASITYSDDVPATGGSALLDMLLGQMDMLYGQTGRIYRELEFKPTTALEYKPKRRMDGGVEFYESIDAILIPLAFEKGAEALSTVMLSDFGFKCYENVKDPENTTAVRYNINLRCQSGDVERFVTYLVTRRYKEENRVVLVWRMFVEGQDKFAGLQTDETGWVVVRPSTNAEEPNLTVGENYTRLVPMSLGSDRYNKERAEQFTKVVIQSGEEDVGLMTRMLDGLLLGVP